jgi:predicted dehydrogenase
MLKKAQLDFGMVGAGAIAQSYSQSFTMTDRASLLAVCDIREDAAEAVAGAHQANSYTNIDEMLKRETLDAVIVCTPPVTHPELCTKVMQAGLHVLCEKPLAIDSSSARQMLEQAKACEVKFTMASKFRYVDDVLRAKAIVTSGILGEIVLFENTFAGHVDMSTRWNSNPEISGGGVLIDNGTHSVDIVRYLLGPLAEVQAVEGKRIQSLEVEDTVRMFLRTEKNEMASIDLSWSLNKQSPYYISIYGAEGTVLVGWKDSKYRRTADQDWILFGKGYNKFEAFRNQIENFAAAIGGEDTLLIKPVDAIASVEVIETAYESLRRDTWMPIKKEPTNRQISA